MTKDEFLALLANELTRKKVADSADIISEYEQHFAFKIADGYSEEEIAAKMGDPVSLAAQYESEKTRSMGGGRKALTRIWLGFTGILAGLIFILLSAWGLVMVASALASLVTSVCLFGGLNVYGLIPAMPYWCRVMAGLSLASLTVLVTTGCLYYAMFVRQLMRAYGRFHHNALAAASGAMVLPSLAISPQIAPKINRRIRFAALISLISFAVWFILTYIVCTLSAGTLEFWHAWGWFSGTGG